jgi:hypothetical protein
VRDVPVVGPGPRVRVPLHDSGATVLRDAPEWTSGVQPVQIRYDGGRAAHWMWHLHLFAPARAGIEDQRIRREGDDQTVSTRAAPGSGDSGMNAAADGMELRAAKRLLDLAKSQGFVFQRVAPNSDGPLFARREITGYHDEIYLGGFDDSCHATRARKSSFIVPGGLSITARVTGDALPVLHTAVSDWPRT